MGSFRTSNSTASKRTTVMENVDSTGPKTRQKMAFPSVLAAVSVMIIVASIAVFSSSDSTRVADSAPQRWPSVLAETTDLASTASFCWLESKPRGAGTVPDTCGSNQDRIGLFCYQKCQNVGPNTKRFGFDCHSVCPKALTDTGLFCRASEYGRGAGYASWNEKKCNDENTQGCEKSLAMWYPKCKAGFHPFGCCICRPEIPKCGSNGLLQGVDLDCTKAMNVGAPRCGQCSGGKEMNGGLITYDGEGGQCGLCYKPCPSTMKGVGPVCWGGPPTGWVSCGMGAAETTEDCTTSVKGQVLSVAKMAAKISAMVASAGTSAVATEVAAVTSDVSKVLDSMSAATSPSLSTALVPLLSTNPELKKTYDALKTAKDLTDSLREGMKTSNKVDVLRVAAEIASVLDPSGISGVVAAYAYPKCDQI